MNNRKYSSGQVREIPPKVEESRTIPFVVSTSTRDRHGTVLNQEKWKLDNFRKNPIVGYMHPEAEGLFSKPDPDRIIAKDISSQVVGTGINARLMGLAKFDPPAINLLAEKVFRKLLIGSLRACSAYFLEIGTGKWGTGEESQGRSNQTYYFAGQELLEWSIVNVPSNPDSGKRGFRFARALPQGALVYAFSLLGRSFSLSQIENMRVRDVLDLLDGKDLGIRSRNPEKVHNMLLDPSAQKDVNAIIEKQQKELLSRIDRYKLTGMYS